MIVTEKSLCNYLNVDRSFLWSCRQKGMPYIRLGSKSIRYDYDEVIQWFKDNSSENPVA
mgnify:FL=1